MSDEHIPHGDAGPLDVLRRGFSVWKDEMRRLLGGSRKKFEISRLEKRLEQEYAHLGRIAEKPRGRKEEKELALQQIGFLKEEIALLRGEGDAPAAATADPESETQ